MLSVSPLPISKNERDGEISSLAAEEFSDGCSGGDFFDDIDLGDLFVGLDDGDVLPDLELDPEMLIDFSVECSEYYNTPPATERDEDKSQKEEKCSSQREESVDQREESATSQSSTTPKNSVLKNGDRGRKSATTHAKGTQGKKKVKVDWTPDLHKRFVQAVEQLGLDKAVPSRILELMGIDCLTRHNIASHLQKYRSHRKHLLAREAEAASWNQRRQVFSGPTVCGSKRINLTTPWLAPTMGFPPHTSMHPFRSLHVWGHPTVDQSFPHLWPKHLARSPSHLWAPPPPPNHSYWQTPLQHGSKDGWVPNAPTQGTPCFPRPTMTAMRLSSPPVPGIPHHALYNKADNSTVMPSAQLDPQLPFDFHPSEETIDEAIGDVLATPMLPLPIGLKAPSLESVLVELQQQGISKIPPS